MKRINFIYIVFFLLLYSLFRIGQNLDQTAVFFYGFAENKETELNHDEAVLVNEILVTPGQEVRDSQLLMRVSRASLDFKINNASSDIERLEAATILQKQELKDRISQLQAKKQSRTAALEAEIKTLEASIELNNFLREDLKTVEAPSTASKNSPNAVKLTGLKNSLNLTQEIIDLEISQIEKELNSIQAPSMVEIGKLKKEINYYETEQEQLAIHAPSDGLIGNIHCKEGENISAFSTLISFYERNPTMVKGFVHENLIPQVKVGDILTVASSLHPQNKVEGKIMGLGTRIVEIPERLRKMPDIKTYGREVLISIPNENPFLQREKVMLNTLDAADHSILFSIFPSFGKQKNKNLSAK